MSKRWFICICDYTHKSYVRVCENAVLHFIWCFIRRDFCSLLTAHLATALSLTAPHSDSKSVCMCVHGNIWTVMLHAWMVVWLAGESSKENQCNRTTVRCAHMQAMLTSESSGSQLVDIDNRHGKTIHTNKQSCCTVRCSRCRVSLVLVFCHKKFAVRTFRFWKAARSVKIKCLKALRTNSHGTWRSWVLHPSSQHLHTHTHAAFSMHEWGVFYYLLWLPCSLAFIYPHERLSYFRTRKANVWKIESCGKYQQGGFMRITYIVRTSQAMCAHCVCWSSIIMLRKGRCRWRLNFRYLNKSINTN